MADLGYGVLDDAIVETAAYIIESSSSLNTSAVFINELAQVDKQKLLFDDIHKLNLNIFSNRITYHYLSLFKTLPNSIAPHWCQISWLKRFAERQRLQENVCDAKLGLVTGDNFQFLRLVWELPLGAIDPLKGWTWFVKGGEYEPYYSHIHLAFNWTKLKFVMRTVSLEHYGLAGATYTERTTSNLSVRVLPFGCIINFAGPGIYPSPCFPIYGLVALLNSAPFQFMIEMVVGGGDASQSGTAARHFLPSLIGSLPSPNTPEELISSLSNYCHKLYELSRIDRNDETREFFYKPTCKDLNYTLTITAENEFCEHEARVIKGTKIAEEIDLKVAQNLGLNSKEIEEVRREIGRPFPVKSLKPERVEYVRKQLATGRVEEDTNNSEGNSRAIIKRCSVLDDLLETICHTEDVSIESLVTLRRKLILTPKWYILELIQTIISYAIGCAFGRWDIRFTINDSLAPKLPAPLDPLPICSPGTLVNFKGLPATSGNIVSEEWLHARPDANTLPPEGTVQQPTISDSEYPITVDWKGILVDDPDHPSDIIRRVRDVLEVIWGDHTEAIEQEACEILGVKDLRGYFCKTSNGGFWTDHIKRYSKSRRKAPIYWLLQSSKKNYALWIYYHRLDKDILFKALVNYVEPKLRLKESNLEQFRSQKAASTSGKVAKQLEKQIDRQEALLSELRDFQDKLRRAANLNLEPDLNDGVVLNIAPLWELVPWSEAKKYWEELISGKYEWSSIGKQLRQKGIV